MSPECWLEFSCVPPSARCPVPRTTDAGFGFVPTFLAAFPAPLPTFLPGPDGEIRLRIWQVFEGGGFLSMIFGSVRIMIKFKRGTAILDSRDLPLQRKSTSISKHQKILMTTEVMSK